MVMGNSKKQHRIKGFVSLGLNLAYFEVPIPTVYS